MIVVSFLPSRTKLNKRRVKSLFKFLSFESVIYASAFLHITKMSNVSDVFHVITDLIPEADRQGKNGGSAQADTNKQAKKSELTLGYFPFWPIINENG